VLIVKDNHKTLHHKIARFFASPTLFEPELRRARSSEVSHGRIEVRRLVVSADVPLGYLSFPHVAQVFCLCRTREHKKSGKREAETIYGITSLSKERASPQRLLSLVRGQWHIENKSHYVRDVTFEEDRSQVRKGSIPQVLAAIRNSCIGLMRLAGHTNIAAACRFHAAQPWAALALLGIRKTE
jgi:predicted transposase YbfD/YdcC